MDFDNHLIPNLEEIFNFPFYWGEINQYEAVKLLKGEPEGTFLLRDSADEKYAFTLSFRPDSPICKNAQINGCVHTRISVKNHRFHFTCEDPKIHTSSDIRELLEFYKDRKNCTGLGPLLLFPLFRKQPFSLKELSRAVICDNTTYDGISYLSIPETLKSFLRKYHYKNSKEAKYVNAL